MRYGHMSWLYRRCFFMFQGFPVFDNAHDGYQYPKNFNQEATQVEVFQ